MFVVFEGIDGSGKTTISNQAVQRLERAGLSVKHLRAEGKFVSPVTEAIRSLARDSRHHELDPHAEFFLYVARDVQLIEEALREALRTHDVVIADRFLYTAEVLARFGRALPPSFTRPVIEAAARGLEPDLVVLVDVDPVLARARRKASKLTTTDARPPSRKGLSGVGLSHRLRRGYLELASEQNQRWFTLANDDSLENSVTRVAQLIEQAVKEGTHAALTSAREAPSRGWTRDTSAVDAPKSPEQALRKLLGWLEARAELEPQVSAYLLAGLFGPDLDDLRRRLAQSAPKVVLSGAYGLDDDVSWELRQALVNSEPAAVARSLSHATAHDPRHAALERTLEARAPEELLRALARRDDAAAWALRERLYGPHPDAVMASLSHLSSLRAERMREDWLAHRALYLNDSYDLARIAARSVLGVGGEHAFAVRDLARVAAPIASLASLSGLTCERSYQQRERALRRAAKVVMETLRSLPDERAFALRWQVVAETKEAVDSIAALDGEQAWRMREMHQDVWPSTVVKSLGALADHARGATLVARQLDKHGHNVSLLKHVAAIALGVHRARRAEVAEA
jgi:dTMP kinase